MELLYLLDVLQDLRTLILKTQMLVEINCTRSKAASPSGVVMAGLRGAIKDGIGVRGGAKENGILTLSEVALAQKRGLNFLQRTKTTVVLVELRLGDKTYPRVNDAGMLLCALGAMDELRTIVE